MIIQEGVPVELLQSHFLVGKISSAEAFANLGCAARGVLVLRAP